VRWVNCEKRLTGSGCRLGSEWGRSRDGCTRWGADRRRERAVLVVNAGHAIVTNGDFVA